MATKGKQHPALSLRRRVCLSVCMTALVIVACEGVLSAAAALSDRVKYHLSPPWARAVIGDPQLGKRMSPYYPGHDQMGYRNQEVPESVDILAVGDSFTYGFTVAPKDSWPRRLESLLQLSVYNAGVGGYGPCEYRVVLDKLLELDPRIVIVGVYIGNDIGDSYRAVYVEGRFPRLKGKREVVLDAISHARARGTLRELAAQRSHFRTGQSQVSAVRAWLSRHSSLYGLLRELHSISIGPKRFVATFEDAAYNRGLPAYDDDQRIRTVFFKPSYRALALDLEDPRIQEGMRILQSCLVEMRRRLTQRNIRMIAVLFPTKAAVYFPLIQTSKLKLEVKTEFENLHRMEQNVTTKLKSFLSENSIEYVETTASLRSYLLTKTPVYPESDNDHPNESGYHAIAETIAPVIASN